jgi:dolichyl-phosphate-mannose--protein O-mannosyl transferase
MSRMATIDTFLIFFSVASQLFFFSFLQKSRVGGGKAAIRDLAIAFLCFGLGFSVKWTAVFGLLAQAMLLLLHWKGKLLEINDDSSTRGTSIKPRQVLLVFSLLLVAGTIYLLSYLPFILQGHSLWDVYNRQWYMLDYHSRLTATHSFSSPWWSWPFLIRPVWLYVSELGEGMVSTITAMGNPAVWWAGFVSMGLTVERALKKRTPASVFLSVVFLFQWLPYALISRATFIYHYYSNVPVLALATAFLVENAWQDRRGRLSGLAYLTCVVVLFIAFFPIISGIPVLVRWRDLLRLVRSWAF